MTGGPTNVPCARCGAPMRERAASHLHDHVAMACACCGAHERLPRDAEARVLALRSLLVQRTWAADAATGPAVAYVRALANPAPYVAPYAVVAVIAGLSLIATPSKWGVISLCALTGAAIAGWISAGIARRRLDATVAPLIRAMPVSAGQTARCRRCGGALPPHGEAFVVCGYCEAPNLVSRTGAVVRAGELGDDIDDARAYAAETGRVVAEVGAFVGRLFRRAFFVGVAGGVAVSALIVALLPAIQ